MGVPDAAAAAAEVAAVPAPTPDAVDEPDVLLPEWPACWQHGLRWPTGEAAGTS